MGVVRSSSRRRAFRSNVLLGAAALAGASPPGMSFAAVARWGGYAGNAQHTALSSVAAQPLDSIHWQTPGDPDPPAPRREKRRGPRLNSTPLATPFPGF